MFYAFLYFLLPFGWILLSVGNPNEIKHISGGM